MISKRVQMTSDQHKWIMRFGNGNEYIRRLIERDILMHCKTKTHVKDLEEASTLIQDPDAPSIHIFREGSSKIKESKD
jgi:hypothetical protein